MCCEQLRIGDGRPGGLASGRLRRSDRPKLGSQVRQFGDSVKTIGESNVAIIPLVAADGPLGGLDELCAPRLAKLFCRKADLHALSRLYID